MTVLNVVEALMAKLYEYGKEVETAKADMTVEYAKLEAGVLYINTDKVKAELEEPASFVDYVTTLFYINLEEVEPGFKKRELNLEGFEDFINTHNSIVHQQAFENFNREVQTQIILMHHHL